MLKFLNQLRLCSRVTHNCFYRPIQIQASSDLVTSSPAKLVSGLSDGDNKGPSISTPFNMVSWDNSQINQQVDCFFFFSSLFVFQWQQTYILLSLHPYFSFLIFGCRFFLVRMNSTYIHSQSILLYVHITWATVPL